MRRRYELMIGMVLILITLITACDPWSTYPPDDRYGGNVYDGVLTIEQLSDSSEWTSR